MVPNRPLASTVLTKLSDHPPPLLLFDATALSDLHVIPCDPVLAVRTRDVRSTCDPMPDPSTVTVALPVVGPLLAIPLLGATTTYDMPLVLVPSALADDTTIDTVPPTPPPLLIITPEVESQTDASTPDPLTRSLGLRVTDPATVVPTIVTVAPPVVGPLLAIPLLGAGALYVHTPVPVPICTPTLTCTSAVHAARLALPPPSLAPTHESDVHTHPRSSFHRSAPLQSCLIEPSCWPPQSTHSCFPSRLHCTVQHCCSTVHPDSLHSSCSTHTRSWSLPQSEMYSLQSLLPCCAPMSPRSTRSTRCCSHPSALFQNIHSSPCSNLIPPLSHSEILSLPCSSTPDCLIAVRLWSPPMLSSTLAAIHPSSQLLPVQDPLLHPRHSCIAGSMSIATHSMWLGFVRIHE